MERQLVVYRLKRNDKRGRARMTCIITQPNSRLPENALYPETVTVQNIADAIPTYRKLPARKIKA